MALDALDAGKDVYLEKPMTHTWEEAQAVDRMARETGRRLQVGTQHASSDRWWRARDAVREGRIGKVIWSQGSYSRNSRSGSWNYPIDPDAGPDNLDWEAFLGSAPKRPFSRERYFRWRKYWDYSGGIATDLFYHKLGPLMLALGAQFPRRVSASGGIYRHPDREVPDTFFMTADYPGEHTVVLCSSMANSFGIEDIIRGHEASIIVHGDRIEIRSEKEYREEFERKYGAPEIEIPTRPRSGHLENFVNAVRGTEDLHFDSGIGYRTQVAISLGVEAYRSDRVMRFDPLAEDVIRKRKDRRI
jgi:predicted dehydrogenase